MKQIMLKTMCCSLQSLLKQGIIIEINYKKTIIKSLYLHLITECPYEYDQCFQTCGDGSVYVYIYMSRMYCIQKSFEIYE